MCDQGEHLFLSAPNLYLTDWCMLHFTAVSEVKFDAFIGCVVSAYLYITIRKRVFNNSAVTFCMCAVSSLNLLTCCWQHWLIQPGQLFPCILSVCVSTGFASFISTPAQLFTDAERSSISQAASCLIYELLQIYDSHTLVHWFFCFTLHSASKISVGEFENAAVRNAALLTLRFPFSTLFLSQWLVTAKWHFL